MSLRFWGVCAIVLLLGLNRAGGQCLDWGVEFSGPSTGLNGLVRTLKVFDDGTGPALYAGGEFTHAGGQPALGVAKWDGHQWIGLPPVGDVFALEVFDDGTGPALYAGGRFRTFEGAPANRLARWTGSTWVPVGGGVESSVHALKTFDDGTGPRLFVGGTFTEVGGLPTDRIAAWDGANWQTWFGGPALDQGHALTYDAARQTTTLFGGWARISPVDDTWTWNGSGWSLAASTGPSSRTDSLLSYDSLRQRVILFGGRPSAHQDGSYRETWSWNGATWTQLGDTVPGMASRYDLSMVYDSVRDRVVLFGGEGTSVSSVQHADTWEFDGMSWAQSTTATTPPARRGHGMVYDAARGRVVMFGGYQSGLGNLADTWEYNGTDWMQVATTGVSARTRPAMAYDSARGRTVLFGGIGAQGDRRDTWTWNGTAWTLLSAGDPAWPERLGPATYDAARDRVVQRTELGATWEFDGTSWALRKLGGFNADVAAFEVHDDGAGAALYAAGGFTQIAGIVSDGVAVLHGDEWNGVGASPDYLLGGGTLASYGGHLYLGGNFNWNGDWGSLVRWDGSSWSLVGNMGFDSAVRALAVFDDGTGPALYATGDFTRYGETRRPSLSAPGTARWDGTTWSALIYSGPQARSESAAAFDPVNRRVMVFGGSTNGAASGTLADTWSWRGRSWVLDTTTGPSARQAHAMVTDTTRSRVVLVGGGGNASNSNSQTWSWDGAAWAQLSASFGTVGRYNHAMAYDADRDRIVLFGGQAGSTFRGDTWEFDGTTWTQVATTGPAPRAGHGMTYDPVTGLILLYGGLTTGADILNDFWAWDGTTWTQIGTGFGSEAFRRDASLVYDPFRQEVLLCGGYGPDGGALGDLWAWNGSQWSQGYYGAGVRRGLHAAAFDERMQSMLVFGGLTDITPATHLRLADTSIRTPSVMSAWAGGAEGAAGYCAAVYDDGSGSGLYFGGNFLTAGLTPAQRIVKWGAPCAQPVISDQPDDVTAAPGETVTFTADAVGTGYFAYRWTRDGVLIHDMPGAVTGSYTRTLRLESWTSADAGEYEMVASSPLGDVISAPARLASLCRADFSGDGVMDFVDYLEFLNLFDASDRRADLNDDGVIDFLDYLEFLNLFDAGC